MLSRQGSVLFSVIVLTALSVFALVAVILLRPDFVAGIFRHEITRHISQHFRDPQHRLHDVTFSLLMGTAVTGLLVQLRTPSQNVAGQVMALVPWVGWILSALLSNAWIQFAPAPLLIALTVAAALLHPARRNFFTSFALSRANWVMLGLVIIAAVPLLVMAATNLRLQRIATNDHAALGHYGFMAAFSGTVIGTAFLASFRLPGGRLTAWVAGFLPIFLGSVSLVFPAVDSSLNLVWALAAIAWGIVFISVALTQGVMERIQKSDSIHASAAAAIRNPRWIYVTGIIAVFLAVLLAVAHLTGRGLGGLHTVP